ncbi:MAG: glycosyltransferase [Planctomycetota bacterium]
MKILHVSHGYLPESAGGVELYLRDVLAAQRDAGHDVKLLTGSLQIWEKAGLEELAIEGIPVYRLHRQDSFFDHYARCFNLDAEAMIVDVLGREQPDVVHVHQWIRLTSNVVELAEAQDIPAVVTLHDVHTSCPRTFRVHRDGSSCFRELAVENCVPCVPRFGYESEDEVIEGVRLFGEQLRSELLRAHKVLVALGTTADLLSQTTGLPRDLYHVVGLAYQRRFGTASSSLPASSAPSASAQSASSAERPFRFACWGNLNVQKGSHLLVRAFRDVVKRLSVPVELHLFGSVSDEGFAAEIREITDGLPVTFHGRYNAQQLLGADIDAAVFPVLCFETFSLALTECFELKLPSIVSDIGALPARAGGAALTVPPGDVPALTAAMVDLASQPELRQKLQARIPPLPPEPHDHGLALVEIYEEVRAAAASGVERLPERERWLRFLERQRAAAEAAGRGPRDPRPPV